MLSALFPSLLPLVAAVASAVSSPIQEGGWSPPPPPPLVPSPMMAQPRFAPFVLPDDARIVAAEDGLERQALLLQETLEKRLGRRIPLGERPARSGDLTLTIGYLADQVAENPEGYAIEVFDDHVALSGANSVGVARAIARLAQLFRFDAENGLWILPPTRIDDAPAYVWRGLMLDLARFPHSVESVREAIDLAFLFSLSTVHLHLSDDQAFTFPADCLPERTDPAVDGPHRGYSAGDLRFLVQYGADRGIVLVPEIDVPAHSSVLIRSRPDLFGHVDPQTGKAEVTGAINMASPRAIVALKKIFDEVSGLFWTSPYVHLGGDEFYAPDLLKLPEFQALSAAEDLPFRLEGGALDAHLNHFLGRMAKFVASRERRPIVWEGFRPTDSAKSSVGTGTWVMCWSQDSFGPLELVEAGYNIINCGWEPLYIVPAQGWASQPEDAFDWSPSSVRQRFGGRTTDLPAGAPLQGAQICVWEQRPEAIVPAVLRLAPELAERMWGSHAAPATYADFEPLAQEARDVVRDMLRPVLLEWESDLGADRLLFGDRVEVRFQTAAHSAPGVIRYVASGQFGAEPTNESPLAPAEPLVLKESTVIAAALFSDDGRRIGGVTQVRFERGMPVLGFEAYRLPRGGAFEPGDFDRLDAAAAIGRGELMAPTPDRIGAIHREQFARVRPEAHIDLRPISWEPSSTVGSIDRERPRIWGRHAVVARGQVTIDEPGLWTLEFQSRGGIGRVTLGDASVTCGSDDQIVRRSAELEAGVYSLCIEHAVLDVHNDLQVWLTPAGESLRSPVSLHLRPLSTLVDANALLGLRSFQD
ncbi:Beta-hexosaminidase [Planctomycetes bacterium Poly30]|uniref:beta-N-acetylhexosaminidase n=2 Tax=Saltatorellus ferox TaxID=2528018 RepID=A0A518F186_9BACT|nr:Beta-hexosaminidase [Planctomycetes bacterium Poly30]